MEIVGSVLDKGYADSSYILELLKGAIPEIDPSMDKWIEELEENFRYGNHNKGDLIEYSGNWETLIYREPDSTVFLNRNCTIQELEALINHMKRHQK
jgi:hypothetical protein